MLMPDIITSRKNEWVKFAARLSADSAFRRKEGSFLVEGARLCEDAVRSGCEVACLFYTEQALSRYARYLEKMIPAARRAFQVAPHVAQLLSETKTSQEVFCICGLAGSGAQPAGEKPIVGRCLALENVQDPGNMGTILRTAEALGLQEVIVAGQSCDVYSPKVLRASMGAVFRLPLRYESDLACLFNRLKRQGTACYAAVPRADARSILEVDFTPPSIVAVGNEGNGLRAETIEASAACVAIPMEGRAESLNASASAAILMWEMMRKGT